MIPRIIHQTWKSKDIPERWLSFQKSWRDHHPDYEYRYWTDDDNRRFIAGCYPQFLSLYDSYRLGVQRADMVRYFIVRHYGGIYVDMDFECLKPLDSLVAGKRLVFGLEPASHARRATEIEGLSRLICNALIASEPEHPFWDYFFPRLAAAKDEDDVLEATGPLLLTRACDSYSRPEEINIVPAELLYPANSEQTRSLGGADLEKLLDGAYAVHHWQGTWTREAALMYARNRILRRRAVKEDR